MSFRLILLLSTLSFLLQSTSALPRAVPILHIETPDFHSPDFYKNPFEVFPEREGQENLVIVACHGIWKGGPTLGESDDEWTLEPYQRGWNETLLWIQHIETGVEIVKDYNGTAVLIFSGGETRPHGGARTEAQSYWV